MYNEFIKNPKFRLLNPYKLEVRKLSKMDLPNISNKLRKKLRLNQ